MPVLYALLLDQDDPKKCTARRLVRFGLAKPLRRSSSISKSAIVLDPFDMALYPEEVREAPSIVVIDGSWKFGPDLFSKPISGTRRRLPLLLAGNPVHYSQPGVLSSAEALAAALYIGGFVDEATEILRLFKWGDTFLTLNKEPLESYRRAGSRDGILGLEREFFPQTLQSKP